MESALDALSKRECSNEDMAARSIATSRPRPSPGKPTEHPDHSSPETEHHRKPEGVSSDEDKLGSAAQLQLGDGCGGLEPKPQQQPQPPPPPQDCCGRERLKRHRDEVAGRVTIPDSWGQENFLTDWIEYSAFDALLVQKGISSARDALVAGGRRAATSQRLRIESRC